MNKKRQISAWLGGGPMVSGNENTGRAKLLWRKNANSEEINERATTLAEADP